MKQSFLQLRHLFVFYLKVNQVRLKQKGLKKKQPIQWCQKASPPLFLNLIEIHLIFLSIKSDSYLLPQRSCTRVQSSHNLHGVSKI